MDPMDPMDEDPPPGSSRTETGAPTTPSSVSTTARTHHTATPLAYPHSSHSAASPAAAPSAEASAGPAQDAPTASKRRRGLGLVTPNACNECRKKRAKCDGSKPCGRCKSLGVPECIYEAPVRQSKERLREELELLNRQKRNRDQVLAALALPDHPTLREDVLARLRNGESVDSISEWLVGALPSAESGAMRPSGISRPTNPPSTHPDSGSHIGSSASASGGSYGGFVSGQSSVVSPVSGRPPHLQQPGPGSRSPWSGQFSSHSVSASSGSGMHPDVMNWHAGGSDRQRIGVWLENEDGGTAEQKKYHGLDKVLSPEIPEMKVPAGAWTKVTDDSRLVQHLLALYFCWEYPTFASLSKEHFLMDFQEGRTRYCSSMLVNALLALGCRFSSHPATRAAPDDPYTSGDHFFRECARQLREEQDHYRMTTIQALGIMSIREASCGRDSESWYYAGQSIRLALEMGLQMNDGDGANDDETAVRSATFWGAYSLDLAWCLATGSLPQCSASPHLPPKPAIIDNVEASLWIPYTDNGTPLSRSSQQPSNVRSVYKCFCELSELVHRSLYILHSPGRSVTSHELQNIYTEYLSWYDRVPDVLRLGHNFTPAVLFAHMYYHFAILLLFRPFIKLRIKDSSLLPRDICLQAADAIQGLSGSYSKLYTLRRTPSFVPYFVLTSAIMHLTIGAEPSPSQGLGETTSGPSGHSSQQAKPPPRINPNLAQSISRGIADLTEMAPCHHFAEQALNILVHLAKRWRLEIRIKESEHEGGRHLKDLLSQPTSHVSQQGIRPAADSLNLFIPEVTAEDVMCTWGPVAPHPAHAGPEAPRDSRRPWLEQEPVPILKETDNPLFWPFPMQGRPIIASGDKLREAGFEFL